MKFKVLILSVTALLLLPNFSPWEGAAGVAHDGELPVSGFFIATNSFPRNTVVDVTNLETGKTTRAIVANTLTNPGLLAIISRDTANLIGMRSGSISRIRIIAPSDPIAYQRFTEGLAQEMPPFDSGGVIKSEEELLTDVYGRDTFVPYSSAQAAPDTSGNHRKGPNYLIEPEWGGTARLEIVDIPRYNNPPAVTFTETPPPPVQERPVQVVQPEPTPPKKEPVQEPPVQVVVREPVPQVQETRQPEIEIQEDVVKDVPAYIAEQSAEDANKRTEGYYAEAPKSEAIKDVSPFTSNSPSNEIVKDVPVYNTYDSVFSEIAKNVEGFISEESPADIAKDVPGRDPGIPAYNAIAKDVPEFIPDTYNNYIVKDIPAYTPESAYNEIAKSVDGFITEGPAEEIAKDVEGFNSESITDELAKDVEHFISGQTERTAKYLDGFDPEKSFEEIAKAIPQFEEAKIADPEPRGVSPAPQQGRTEFNIVEAEERRPGSDTNLYGIDPNDIIPGITSAAVERPRPAPEVQTAPAVTVPAVTAPAVTDPSFSIRSISALDRGQYYVQIASIPENSVESTLRQFNPQFFSYNPVVFRDRDNSYRILIGPLNQGESAAVLARFKSIGYRDAFVRRGG